MTDVTFPVELRSFLDANGRLKQWPSKQKLQLLAVAALAEAIPAGRNYTEKEVNELLNEVHTFGDPTLLRRYLKDLGYLGRTPDGRQYWRVTEEPGDGA